MKLAIASDLHLEFVTLELKNTENADVLVLAGDILVESDLREYDPHAFIPMNHSDRFTKFFENVCAEFPHVVYVMGNHEHYHGDIKYTSENLKRKLGRFDNLHILDREIFDLADVRFVGSTLWTDMNRDDPLTLYHTSRNMGDFSKILNSNRMVSRKVPLYKKGDDGKYLMDENNNYIPDGFKFKEDPAKFCPQDSVEEHRKCLDYIKWAYEETIDKKIVVVGHHTPSFLSMEPMYTGEHTMNGAYHSDLSEFILDRDDKIALWVHGHTHHSFDYTIGKTRVVCNPRGYKGYEAIAEGFALKYIEV